MEKEFRYTRGGDWSSWLPISRTEEIRDIKNIVAFEFKEQMTREKARELYPEAFARFEGNLP